MLLGIIASFSQLLITIYCFFRPDIQVDSAGTNPVLPRISEDAGKFLKMENASHFLEGESEGLEEKKLDE